MYHARLLIHACLLLCAGQASARSGRLPARAVVAVVLRSGIGPYEALAQSFRARLRTPVELISLADPHTSLIERIQALQPDLVFAIGQSAYELARKAQVRPLLHAHVYRDAPGVPSSRLAPTSACSASGEGHSVCGALGVNDRVRPERVLELIKSLRPRAKDVAVLSGRAARWMMPQILEHARRGDMTLTHLSARSPAHALTLLREFPGKADALWMIADLDIMSEQVVRYAIALQFRRRMPLIAPTRQHVQRGALASLDYPPEALGRRAGDIAAQYLRHARRSSRERELARWSKLQSPWGGGAPRLSLNRLTAERIDIALANLTERAELVE